MRIYLSASAEVIDLKNPVDYYKNKLNLLGRYTKVNGKEHGKKEKTENRIGK